MHSEVFDLFRLEFAVVIATIRNNTGLALALSSFINLPCGYRDIHLGLLVAGSARRARKGLHSEAPSPERTVARGWVAFVPVTIHGSMQDIKFGAKVSDKVLGPWPLFVALRRAWLRVFGSRSLRVNLWQ